MVAKYILKDCFIFYKRNKKYFKFVTFIIFIGVLLYLGFSACFSDINKTVVNNYKKTNHFDLKITSDAGFSYFDGEILKQLKEIRGVRLVKSQITNSLINNNYYNLKISSISKDKNIKNEDYINRITISNGKYPTTINEGLIDEDFASKNNIYIGDLITLTDQNSNNFKAKKIKIVGFVKSFETKENKIDSNLYIEEKNFLNNYYKDMYITFKNNNPNDLDKYKENILKIIEPIEKENKEKVFKSLTNAITSLEINLQNFYLLTTPENTLNESIKTYSETLEYKKKELENLNNSKLTIIEKNEITTSNNFNLILNKTKTLSNFFPFLYLSTTLFIIIFSIFKFINKNKQEIKTLRIYGFGNKTIILKYILLHFLICIKGILLGIIFHKLPTILIWLFNNSLNDLELYFTSFDLSKALFAALFITILTINFIIICYYLIHKRKYNNKLLSFFSKKINKFNNKLKNIKPINNLVLKNLTIKLKENIILILFITSCFTLLSICFNIQDIIKNTENKQLNTLYKFDLISSINNNYNNEEKTLLQSKINDLKYVKNSIKIFETDIKLKKNYNVKLIIYDNFKDFNKFININNKNKKEITITKNIAKKLNIKKNDKTKITINEKEYKVKVHNITSNYLNDYIYMSNSLYKQITKEKASYNKLLITFKNKKNIESYSKEIYLFPEINKVTKTTELIENYKTKIIFPYYLGIYFIVCFIILSIYLFIKLINDNNTKSQINYLKTNGFYYKEIILFLIKEKIILFLISFVLSLILSIIFTFIIFKILNINFYFKLNIISFISLFIIIIIYILITCFCIFLNKKKCK